MSVVFVCPGISTSSLYHVIVLPPGVNPVSKTADVSPQIEVGAVSIGIAQPCKTAGLIACK